MAVLAATCFCVSFFAVSMPRLIYSEVKKAERLPFGNSSYWIRRIFSL